MIDNRITCRAKVTGAIVHMEHVNLSNVKSVGEGVPEYPKDFGPGCTGLCTEVLMGWRSSIAGSPNVWVW